MAKPVAFDGGSPINKGNADDDLDFEKELLEGGGAMAGGSNPMLEHSRIEGGDFQPPEPVVKKPPPPPKAPVLSFSEQIALAANKLKSAPPKGEGVKNNAPIPKKGGADKEESKNDAP